MIFKRKYITLSGIFKEFHKKIRRGKDDISESGNKKCRISGNRSVHLQLRTEVFFTGDFDCVHTVEVREQQDLFLTRILGVQRFALHDDLAAQLFPATYIFRRHFCREAFLFFPDLFLNRGISGSCLNVLTASLTRDSVVISRKALHSAISDA